MSARHNNNLTITDISSNSCVCMSWASSCRAQPLCWASFAALERELRAVIILRASGAASIAFFGQVILLLASRSSASIIDLAAPPGRNSYMEPTALLEFKCIIHFKYSKVHLHYFFMKIFTVLTNN